MRIKKEHRKIAPRSIRTPRISLRLSRQRESNVLARREETYEKVGSQGNGGKVDEQDPDMSKLGVPTTLTVRPLGLQHNRQKTPQHIQRHILQDPPLHIL